MPAWAGAPRGSRDVDREGRVGDRAVSGPHGEVLVSVPSGRGYVGVIPCSHALAISPAVRQKTSCCINTVKFTGALLRSS